MKCFTNGALRRHASTLSANQNAQCTDVAGYRDLLFQCHTLSEGKYLHEAIARDRLGNDESLGNSIVHMYLRCRSLSDAKETFDTLDCRNVVTWTAMITANTQNGHYAEAFRLYGLMQLNGVMPNRITYVAVLNTCIDSSNMKEGGKIHHRVTTAGNDSDLIVGNALLNLYSKCGSLDEALDIFEHLKEYDVIACSTMISTYSKHGKSADALVLFQLMQLQGILPDRKTVRALLSGRSGAKDHLLHSCIVGTGLESDVEVGTALLNMYTKCGKLEMASKIFAQMPEKNIVTWNLMIAAYAESGDHVTALHLLKRMQLHGTHPDKITFVNSLNACKGPSALVDGKLIHASCIESGHESNVVLGTALINMYSKCDKLQDARKMFDKMQDRNIISWNAMITAYSQHGQYANAIRLFRTLQSEGFVPSVVTFATVLHACGGAGALREGKLIHTRITSYEVIVGTALIDMYCKCRHLAVGRKVFDKMPERDVITWTTMIAAYAQDGYFLDAIQLFGQMKIKPDKITFVAMADACANAGKLAEGESLEVRAIECGLEGDVLVGTVLLHMYSTFGKMDKACEIFVKLDQRNIVSWNAIIGACTDHGCPTEALKYFRQMLVEGMKPNSITFASILDAFVHQAYLGEGRLIHAQITESGYENDVFVGTALVHMYGNCASLADACAIFSSLSHHNEVSWNALIAAYAQQGHCDISFQLFQNMQHEGITPDDITFVTLVSACSHAGMVEKGFQYIVSSMVLDYSVLLHSELYGCLIDLLGRAGRLNEAEYILRRFAPTSDYTMWMTLLSACRLHGDVQRGERAGERVIQLGPLKSAPYLVASQMSILGLPGPLYL